MPRLAAKKDANHAEIAEHLRSLGWSVLDLSRAHFGVPDLCVGRLDGKPYCALVEVKKPGEGLTDMEAKVRANWDAPYFIATSPEQIAAELYIAWKGLE